ncbi:Protein RMD5 like protein B [Pteropus alecto]|uniref:Protein RMD5 like protein B n=1 Tax=Pteropus alecto TaxID=9402 RepID=L5JVS6_PTEAL|nr:Protein RMD5 like protein B [Pteropus alecto]
MMELWTDMLSWEFPLCPRWPRLGGLTQWTLLPPPGRGCHGAVCQCRETGGQGPTEVSDYGEHCEQNLEELGHVGQLQAELARCCQKIKDMVQKLASDHRDIHSSVSQVGKAIDRVGVWVPRAGVVMPGAGIHEVHQESKCGELWDSRAKQQQILQVAIVEHSYQQGVLGVADELCQESTLNEGLDFKQLFLELNRILEALHEQDLGLALKQCLLKLNSPLEFQLPSTQHFQPFAWLHQHVLVYLWLGLKKSPYCHLLDNSHWAKICETFTFDAFSLLGFSMESPLSVRLKCSCPMEQNLADGKCIIF